MTELLKVKAFCQLLCCNTWYLLQESAVRYLTQGLYSLEFLKKSLNLPSSFLDLDKVWKMVIKVWTKGKKFFFFQSYNKCFTSEIFFDLVKFYSISTVRLQLIMKEALFLYF